MTSTLLFISAIGCGLIGGVFFAFSTFVMQGLGRLPASQGAAAMQAINITAVTPVFMAALFGTAAVCVAAMIAAGDAYPLAGGFVYLIGVIGTTAAFNVPRNNRLAAADADAPATAELWARYLAEWTRLEPRAHALRPRRGGVLHRRAHYLTVRVPFMPPSAWPGTVQR